MADPASAPRTDAEFPGPCCCSTIAAAPAVIAAAGVVPDGVAADGTAGSAVLHRPTTSLPGAHRSTHGPSADRVAVSTPPTTAVAPTTIASLTLPGENWHASAPGTGAAATTH